MDERKGQTRKAVGARLRALRLFRGFQTAKAAAAALGINEVTYRAVEAGRRSSNGELLRIATERFDVAVEWLMTGSPSTSIEAVLDRLASALMRASTEPMAKDVARRLTLLRRRAGFATASEAARAKGWPVSRYTAHESRRKGVGTDAAVTYALAFGGSVPQLLFDAQESAHKLDASAARSVGTTAAAPSAPDAGERDAPWLRPWRRGSWAEVPVLLGLGREVALSDAPLVLPIDFLPSRARGSDRLFGFAIPDRSSDGAWSMIALISPEKPGCPGVEFDGSMLRRAVGGSETWQDPLGALPFEGPVRLGKLVAELRFQG